MRLEKVAYLEVAVLSRVSLERGRGARRHGVLERILQLKTSVLALVHLIKLFQSQCALMDFVCSLPDLLVALMAPGLFLILL